MKKRIWPDQRGGGACYRYEVHIDGARVMIRPVDPGDVGMAMIDESGHGWLSVPPSDGERASYLLGKIFGPALVRRTKP